MGNYLNKVSKQILEFISGLSAAKKVAGVGLGAVAVIGLGIVFYWASRQSFRPLMTNLNPADAAQIMRVLREKKIPYKTDQTGKVIEIPPEEVDALRLELATMDMPQASIVGYEVFDQQKLGSTSFVQRVNKKRALEGELTRTITSIKGVKQARVHLAIPAKSTFVEDQKDPTASVVLDLNPGVRLNEKQVYGIGTLVSKAVEGLQSDAVVVVDSYGKVLSRNTNDPVAARTAEQHDIKSRIEESIEKRVDAMLARVVGDGRVVTRVSAEIDFSKILEKATTYDQDGSAIMSSQKRTQSAAGSRPGARGPAGAATNLPDGQGESPSQVKTDTNSNREITNYKVPGTLRTVEQPVGQVKKISVAVLLDGKKVTTTKDDGTLEIKTEAWAPEKLAEFQTLVSNAIGFDAKRGDKIEVKNMNFQVENFDEAERLAQSAERRAYLQKLIGYLVTGIIIVMFFMFVVRPFIKWITENTIESVDTFLPQTIEELEKLQKNANVQSLDDVVPDLPENIDPEKVEGEMIKEKVITLIDTHPQKAALILRDWVRGKSEQKEKKGA